MKRWLFYNFLAWSDIHRLGRITRYQVTIVAGICLPVLLLLGLKRGHVAELRRNLVTSPSGRQVVFWSARQGDLLNIATLDRLRNSLLQVDVIVPEAQRLVRIDPQHVERATNEPGAKAGNAVATDEESLVTLYSTDQGDPILHQYGADVLAPGERAVVLAKSVAQRLNARVGDQVSLTVFRRKEGVDESHSFAVKVKGIIPSDKDARTGYANVELLSQLESYVQGHAVAQLGLPAIQGLAPPDEYEHYLVFCQKGPSTDLNEDDRAFLTERGIQCRTVEDKDLKSLYGLLKSERLNELNVYLLSQGSGEKGTRDTLKASPMFIAENTRAIDDFVLRWNPPMEFPVDGTSVRLIGLSLPTISQTGGWIREYLSQPVGFDFESSLKNPFQIRFVGPPARKPASSAKLRIAADSEIPLQVFNEQTSAEVTGGEKADDAPTSSSSDDSNRTPVSKETTAPSSQESKEMGIVPSNLLAWLKQAKSKAIVYDAPSRAFTSLPEPAVFDKARLYTKTIDHVPDVVERLSSDGYAVLSESNRIAEIHEQDRSLQTLVVVVALGVFIFGTVTVVGVLVDATDRKRGTIGILRVMGMSRLGIFFIVVLRAMIVGLFAATLTIALGALIAWAMTVFKDTTILTALVPQSSSWPKVSFTFQIEDYLIVGIGALLCSGLGAIIPARRASAIDPFDAIVEGKFH